MNAPRNNLVQIGVGYLSSTAHQPLIPHSMHLLEILKFAQIGNLRIHLIYRSHQMWWNCRSWRGSLLLKSRVDYALSMRLGQHLISNHGSLVRRRFSAQRLVQIGWISQLFQVLEVSGMRSTHRRLILHCGPIKLILRLLLNQSRSDFQFVDCFILLLQHVLSGEYLLLLLHDFVLQFDVFELFIASLFCLSLLIASLHNLFPYFLLVGLSAVEFVELLLALFFPKMVIFSLL